jgi:hypothetical protein
MQGMQCKHPPFIQLFYYINYCSWVKLRAMIAPEEKLRGEDLFPYSCAINHSHLVINLLRYVIRVWIRSNLLMENKLSIDLVKTKTNYLIENIDIIRVVNL